MTTKTDPINIELIADEGVLYFLETLDGQGKFVQETKDLLQRKISGDNPSRDEWRDNAFANDNAYTYAIAYTYANGYPYTYNFKYGNSDTYNYTYDSDPATDTADYIISLLNGYIEPIEQLDSKVLKVWNKGTTTLNRYRGRVEVALHPKGKELEKHFGKRMAAMIIHYISTGKKVDYFGSKEEVMADLKLTSAKENKNEAN